MIHDGWFEIGDRDRDREARFFVSRGFYRSLFMIQRRISVES